MTKRILITGDTHRVFTHLLHYNNEPTIMIILGDACINYFCDERDEQFKESLCKKYNNITFFCLRGNHEQRPELCNIPTVEVDTEQVHGLFYHEDKYPNIYYFVDGTVSYFDNFRCYAMGGAYSVDKYYRLAMDRQWFPQEQITIDEARDMRNVFEQSGEYFDFIFTHTCPFSWQPFDLFLEGLDQSTVDNGMEYFFQSLLYIEEEMEEARFGHWGYGHFHGDRWSPDKRGFMLSNRVVNIYDVAAGHLKEAE